ncbi:MAG: hypothetical protein ACXAD7_09405 [Candidatus Kariarchaeaceae archaeon]
MGQMLLQYDIKTPSPDVDADDMIKNIRENLPEDYILQEKVEVKPMFFGIKAAVCQFVCSDKDGTLQDKLENYLNDLEGLGEYELSFVTKL